VELPGDVGVRRDVRLVVDDAADNVTVVVVGVGPRVATDDVTAVVGVLPRVTDDALETDENDVTTPTVEAVD
jgi:hypothetical protein